MKPKHLRYRSQAHAQIANGPIASEEAADQRDAEAITRFFSAVLGTSPRKPKRKRKKSPTKGKPKP